MCSAGVVFASKLTFCELWAAISTGCSNAMFSMRALQHALLRLVGDVFDRRLHRHIGRISTAAGEDRSSPADP